MTNLLCRIGMHHVAWHPRTRGSRETWLQVRKCVRCGQPIPRNHR